MNSLLAKRVWVPIVAGLCVIGAVVLVLVIRRSGDDDKTTEPAAARSTTSTPTTSVPTTSRPASSRPATSAPTSAGGAVGNGTVVQAPGGSSDSGGSGGSSSPLSTRAGVGLRKFIAAHRLRGGVRSLTSCPLGSVRPRSKAIDAAAKGTSHTYKTAQAVVQAYRVATPNNGSVGDRGEALSCFGKLSNRTILGLSATTNTNPVPKGAIKGLNGPRDYADGNTYAKVTEGDLCSVYWVPPHRDYDLVVVFRTKANPNVSQCRKGFAVAAPTMLSSLAALAG